MADTKHNDAFDDELLSAYVDGELSGDELALVEQRLHDDSGARQLVEELRTLSTTIQALPPETVGKDLREAVLQRAERSTLSTQPKIGARRWGWAAMALAAALMLMIFQPEAEQDAQPVAAVVPEQDQAERSMPELQAPAVTEDGVEERIGLAESKPEAAGTAVDRVELARDLEMTDEAEPVQIVHVAVNNGIEEFDKLLLSNRVMRVANPPGNVSNRMRNKTRSSYGRQLEPAEKPDSESAPSEEVLVEGTAGQIQQLVFACQNDTARYSNVRVEGLRLKSVLGDSFSSPAIAAKSKGQAAPTFAVENESSLAKSNKEKPTEGLDEKEDLDTLDAEGSSVASPSVANMVDRIRVLFVLYASPQAAKPVPAKKKANSSKNIGGKAS